MSLCPTPKTQLPSILNHALFCVSIKDPIDYLILGGKWLISILIEEGGFAVNLGESHNKGACVLASSPHPGKNR